MKPDEYASFDAVGLAGLVASGQVTASELLDAALAQLRRANPSVNAVTSILEDRARRQIEHGLPPGPFHGVPFLVKDQQLQLAGTTTTASCRVLEGMVASADSVIAERYRSAGLVIFGKTNTPELGLSTTTEPRMYGPTRNPYDLSRSAGGSSGGAAAAVATGMAPMAHGSDAGGSIRIPASCCGLVGLKPTRGRVPLGPSAFEISGGATVVHAVTRTLRDSAALLDATAGPAMGDPYRCAPPERPFADELGRPSGHLRIAVTTRSHSGAPIDPEVSRVLAETADRLDSLGHHVAEEIPPFDAETLMAGYGIVVGVTALLELDRAAARRARPWDDSELEPETLAIVEMGRNAGAAAYARAVAGFHQAGRVAGQFHADWDVVLSPTVALLPPTIGTFRRNDPWETLTARSGFAVFPGYANITGQPSISLPLGRSAGGLPIGMMFTGALGDEGQLLRLASQLEPWFS